jgi:hypothetical protein
VNEDLMMNINNYKKINKSEQKKLGSIEPKVRYVPMTHAENTLVMQSQLQVLQARKSEMI